MSNDALRIYCEGVASDFPEAKIWMDNIIRLHEALINPIREVVAKANNSLYGSQGFFLSLDGGPADKYHLARPIEKMKAELNYRYRDLQEKERNLTVARNTIKLLEACLDGDTKDLFEELKRLRG